jgi:hypothetical protein
MPPTPKSHFGPKPDTSTHILVQNPTGKVTFRSKTRQAKSHFDSLSGGFCIIKHCTWPTLRTVTQVNVVQR